MYYQLGYIFWEQASFKCRTVTGGGAQERICILKSVYIIFTYQVGQMIFWGSFPLPDFFGDGLVELLKEAKNLYSNLLLTEIREGTFYTQNNYFYFIYLSWFELRILCFG